MNNGTTISGSFISKYKYYHNQWDFEKPAIPDVNNPRVRSQQSLSTAMGFGITNQNVNHNDIIAVFSSNSNSSENLTSDIEESHSLNSFDNLEEKNDDMFSESYVKIPPH